MVDRKKAVDALCEDPCKMLDLSIEDVFGFDREEIERFQLAGIQKRFRELRPKLPSLDFLAEDNRIDAISAIDDVVPLLYPHTEYKSYPLSLIDNCQFKQLNDWLDDFTTHDLSGLDLEDCESLDDWLDVVEKRTPVRVVSSSGTSGKLSLLPRSTDEEPCVAKLHEFVFAKFGQEPGFKDPYGPDVYHIMVTPREGRISMSRSVNARVRYGFRGDESHVLSLGGRLPTDVLWMLGRMNKARAEGSMEQLKATKAWQRLNSRLDTLETSSIEEREAFFKDILVCLKGKSVAMVGGHVFYWEMLDCARKHGLEIAFAEDSCLLTGGGAKGMASMTEAQLDQLAEAFPKLNDLYGCSELMGLARRCREGHYHMPPSVVPFVLDPNTGTPYPRSGIQTGRYAGFDLWAQTYWAGIITGDEVTMNWDGNCGCGRKGPYIAGEVTRYSDKNGGDDKITCQRTAAAVEEMMASIRES